MINLKNEQYIAKQVPLDKNFEKQQLIWPYENFIVLFEYKKDI